MNKKGFSLIELLAVLIILALITVLVSSLVTNTINNAKLTITDAQERSILNAAEKWSVDNSEVFDDIDASQMQVGLDVVFILDVSGSMEFSSNKIYASDGVTKISRTQAAMEAIDSAMAILIENNDANRISIVTFGKVVKTFLPLNNYSSSDGTYVKYIKPISGEYGTISSAGLIYMNGASVSVSYSMSNVVTYTQGGIIGGANVLKNSDNKKNRIPVVILLSDGSPTAYLTSGYNSECNVSSTCGGSENANAGYYMIKAAIEEKKVLKDTYGSQTFFYTIGLGISENSFGELVLNPTSENINSGLNKSGAYYTLANKLKNENGVNSYSYADKAFVGKMDANQLKNIFTSIAGEVIEATKVVQVCVTVQDLYDGGYLSTKDIDLASGEAASTYVIMNYNEATNQYNFNLAKTADQISACEALLNK